MPNLIGESIIYVLIRFIMMNLPYNPFDESILEDLFHFSSYKFIKPIWIHSKQHWETHWVLMDLPYLHLNIFSKFMSTVSLCFGWVFYLFCLKSHIHEHDYLSPCFNIDFMNICFALATIYLIRMHTICIICLQSVHIVKPLVMPNASF